MALDQLTKWWVLEGLMQPPQRIILTPFFNLVSGWNRGVSFGMFSSDSPWSGWILSLLALGIVAFLVHLLRKADCRHNIIAIGLIIGGAIGNVIDRLVHGAVYDFLDIHISGHHWPAFNVADSGITIGAVILVLDSLLRKPENGESSGSPNDSVEKT
ncbi:MAG: signal peptidase II [Rhodospirillales bacterium]|nr:signal peptidase II [Rhodospirillales bacterium]